MSSIGASDGWRQASADSSGKLGMPDVAVRSFVEGGGADGLFANFDPALRELLEFGEGDLGKALLSALRRTKT